MFTRTTKERLQELEAAEDALRESIRKEEAKPPKIDKDMILVTLHKFRDLDIRVTKNRERLIDGFIKAVFVYDNRFEVFTTYSDESFSIPTQEELDRMTSSSPVDALASPKRVCCRTEVLQQTLFLHIFCENVVAHPEKQRYNRQWNNTKVIRRFLPCPKK